MRWLASPAFFSLALLNLHPLAAQVLTAQYDNARTGATLRETTLTSANVNAANFGHLFSLPVDGDVYAQPLYVPGVEIPGKGVHNVVFIATEHDSVYAYDAVGQPAEPLWRVNFLDPRSGVAPVPARDLSCRFIAPEVGITPTPVIDAQTGTLYVLARTKESGGAFSSARYVQKLHALAITTGVEKFGGPVEISASVTGRTAGAATRNVEFSPYRELPRAALLLTRGQVYLTWGSACDVGPYHGWVMAYDARTLKQTAVLNTSPDSEESGIWQSDMGPAADEAGNVFVATGNGKFSAASNGHDYGDSLLRLNLSGHALNIADYFTPYNEKSLNTQDADLGSGGPMLLPARQNSPAQVLIGGKDGNLFALDRGRLGKFQATSNSHALQVIRFPSGIYSAAAYWNGHVYFLSSSDYLSDFAFDGARLDPTPRAHGAERFANPGATPVISANGSANGIVWLIQTKAWNGADRPAVLRAFDAANVARELYNSEQQPDRDRAGLTLRFTIPTIANGRVYVDAKNRVDVYGLLPQPPK